MNRITVTTTPKMANVQVMQHNPGMSLVDLGKKLLEAAKLGDTESVRNLMTNGAPFTTDWMGTSPLHFAVQNGHHQTAEVLLRSGISRDARTKVDRTPLHEAAIEGHLSLVELLLTNSADIDSKDLLKMTPLHWATEKGHLAIIQMLVQHGADLNVGDKFKRSPLDIAMTNGRTDIAQILQIAQHTDIGGVSEGEAITIETTEPIMTETVTSAVKTEMSSDSEQSSTSVLATLAALAEATGPISAANGTPAEGYNWLDTQGITMISTAPDGSIITSAVENGHTLTLTEQNCIVTEAGRIALNYIRQDGLAEGVPEEAGLETVVGEDGQKVITIVSNQNGEELSQEGVLVTVGEDGTPVEAHIVGGVDGEVMTEVGTDLHSAIEGNGTVVIEEADGSTITVTPAVDNETEDGEGDKENVELRRQLIRMQQQAERYKQQLRMKEQEAEQFRQRLTAIETVTVISSDEVASGSKDPGGKLQAEEEEEEELEEEGTQMVVLETTAEEPDVEVVMESVVEEEESPAMTSQVINVSDSVTVTSS